LAAPFLSLIPVFGISTAFVLLGERLQVTQWIGAILILVAMTSIARLSRPETHPEE
jgi:drug/metabolite transporter (DMT)-like permease